MEFELKTKVDDKMRINRIFTAFGTTDQSEHPPVKIGYARSSIETTVDKTGVLFNVRIVDVERLMR